MRRYLVLMRSVPLLGPLVDCGPEDHFETVKQVLVTLLLATAPFTLGAVILCALFQPHITIRQAFWSTIWDGELFMSATSLLAPIFWIALEDPKGARKFPSRLPLFLIVAVVIAISCIFFALGLAKSHLEQPYTFHTSVVIFWASVAVLYLSTVYHTNRVNTSGALRVQEQEFLDEYRRHRQ